MITIKFFAMLKDRVGCDEVQFPFTGETIAELLRQVSASYPALSDILSTGSFMISINQELVKQDAAVQDGDEVALMPPFSGGSGVGNA